MSLNQRQKLEVAARELAREMRKNATVAEQVLWETLRANRLNGIAFYRQKALFHDLAGYETFFIADFYCHQARLVIEIDGGIHDSRVEEDREQTRVLNFLGLTVIRFTNNQVLDDLPSVLRDIVAACARFPPGSEQKD